MKRLNKVWWVGVLSLLAAWAPDAMGAMGVRGAIVALEIRTAEPILRLKNEHGAVLTFAIDPQRTHATQDGRAIELEALRVGHEVEVVSAERDGKTMAKDIKVLTVHDEAAPQGVLMPGTAREQ